jgi:acyl-CoA reductase-like NAD-dependent aldehyde dehydrogenase
MELRNHLLIAGEWVATEKALPVVNPYDESVICDTPITTEPVIDAAIAAAYPAAGMPDSAALVQDGR